MNMALETQNHTGNKKSSPDKNIPQFFILDPEVVIR